MGQKDKFTKKFSSLQDLATLKLDEVIRHSENIQVVVKQKNKNK